MTEFNPEQFEAELQTLRPGNPSQDSLERLLSKLPTDGSSNAAGVTKRRPGHRVWNFLKWLIPAGAAAAVAFYLIPNQQHQRRVPPGPSSPTKEIASAGGPSLKANHVEIDRQLLTNFDAVARLPSGQPVRFRCEQWMDKVRVRDSNAGLVLERTTPRLEILPVSFETY